MIVKNDSRFSIWAVVVVATASVLITLFVTTLQQSRNDNAVATPVSDIAAPVGWKMERMSASNLNFVKEGGDPSKYISVHATQFTGSLQDEIRTYYSDYPFDAQMTYRPSVSAVEDGWSVVRGNLILRLISRESDVGTSINYQVFYDGVIYTFSMYYQLYNPSTKQFEVVSPEDVKTLQSFVQTFAQNL